MHVRQAALIGGGVLLAVAFITTIVLVAIAPSTTPTPTPTSASVTFVEPASYLDASSRCVNDRFANSIYGSGSPTRCGTRDYNGDGFVDLYVCCDDASARVANAHDERIIYNVTACAAASTRGMPLDYDANGVCGACEIVDNGSLLLPGWRCASSADRVRPCPIGCTNVWRANINESLYPDVGECGHFIDHCLSGGEGVRCCAVVTL